MYKSVCMRVRLYGLVSYLLTLTSGIDEASGVAYYYNELTGASQWEPPQSQ